VATDKQYRSIFVPEIFDHAVPDATIAILPKYSPDLNPIEQFFAKFKHWLRKAARRTTEAVYNAIGPILDTVSAAEWANYFVNAGYDQT
jgi:transposase